MTSLVRVDPGVFPPKEVAFVIAAACSWPADHDLPLSHFSLRELAQHIAKDVTMSRTSVWRCLHAHALYPWRKRSWISPRDPLFLERAAPILDLYQGFWQGEPLGEGDFVLSADEKPNNQALRGTQASRTVIPGHPAHIESDYIRCGTLAYLAALDIQSGRVIGRIDERTGTRPFMKLVDKVMTQKPFSKARRVFWIVDNGASHHPKTFPDRLKARYPNAIAVHLPVHASWLNQIELFFSILQRKLLKRGRFAGLFDLGDAILQYQSRYNQTAKPFKWGFTAADLKERLATPY